MNRRILSSLTSALIVATLGLPLSGQAGPAHTDASESDADAEPPSRIVSTAPPELPVTSTGFEVESESEIQTASIETVKVGERQSGQTQNQDEAVIAQIQPHEIEGRQAATLYIHNIPVLTFLGSHPSAAASDTKVGEESEIAFVDASNKVAGRPAPHALPNQAVDQAAGREENLAASNDPVWRATELAATFNQAHQTGVDAASITVEWREGDRYAILLDGQELVEMDDTTILPDTTRDLAEDALQATNRLRRLLGQAEPLTEISGMPRRVQQIAQVPQRFRTSGLASWYGPGFNGRRSASGEVFNQNALTAAHRTLPFGTRIRVTNLRNGQEVIVRINDRGPFHGNRILDLSAGAARAIGLIQLGVAPVQIDVLDPSQPESIQ